MICTSLRHAVQLQLPEPLTGLTSSVVNYVTITQYCTFERSIMLSVVLHVRSQQYRGHSSTSLTSPAPTCSCADHKNLVRFQLKTSKQEPVMSIFINVGKSLPKKSVFARYQIWYAKHDVDKVTETGHTWYYCVYEKSTFVSLTVNRISYYQIIFHIS